MEALDKKICFVELLQYKQLKCFTMNLKNNHGIRIAKIIFFSACYWVIGVNISSGHYYSNYVTVQLSSQIHYHTDNVLFNKVTNSWQEHPWNQAMCEFHVFYLIYFNSD